MLVLPLIEVLESVGAPYTLEVFHAMFRVHGADPSQQRRVHPIHGMSP